MSEEEILLSTIEDLQEELEEKRRPSAWTRAWRFLFGRLVYGGPETCGHCKRWRRPKRRLTRVECTKSYHDGRSCPYSGHWVFTSHKVEGNCKLLFGSENTTKDETCDRFRARRRYKHRVRSGC
jgi:hypothetical protein